MFLATGQPGYVLMHEMEICYDQNPLTFSHELGNCWKMQNWSIKIYTYDTDNACCIFINAFSINQSFQFTRDFHSFREFIIRMNMHFYYYFLSVFIN